MKAYRKINFNVCFILYVLKLVNGLVLYERSTTHLDHLLQKLLQYQCHKENYIQSKHEEIIQNGLQLNKKQHLNQFLVTLIINGELFYTKQKKI